MNRKRSYWVQVMLMISICFVSFVTNQNSHVSINGTIEDCLDTVGTANCIVDDHLQFYLLEEDPIAGYIDGPPPYVWVDPDLNVTEVEETTSDDEEESEWNCTYLSSSSRYECCKNNTDTGLEECLDFAAPCTEEYYSDYPYCVELKGDAYTITCEWNELW